jgi:hypothetical protein
MDPLSIAGMALGGTSILGGLLGSKEPKPIDPKVIGGYFDQGGYVADIGKTGRDLMDPGSELNSGIYNELNKQSSDSMFQRALINRRNAAASGTTGQSGIMNQLQRQDTLAGTNAKYGAYNQMLGQNFQMGAGMLGQAAQFDMAKGEAMASAAGQNITNQNNYSSAMSGNLMNMGSGLMSAAMMSDKRAKSNIKKIGKAKTRDGKSVNVYKYNYKGDKKPQVGVIAQEIKKSHPDAVIKSKNGMMKVNYGKLF